MPIATSTCITKSRVSAFSFEKMTGQLTLRVIAGSPTISSMYEDSIKERVINIFTFLNRIHTYVVGLVIKILTVQLAHGTEKITFQACVTAHGITEFCLKLGIPAPAFEKQEAFDA